MLDRLRASPRLFALVSTGLLILVFAWPLYDEWRLRIDWIDSSLAQIEPRHARVLGLGEARDRLLAAVGEVGSVADALVFGPEGGVERAAAEQQQRLRDLAAEAGFVVVGSQILPAGERPGFAELGIVLTLDGDLPNLVQLDRAAHALRPLVVISGMRITPLSGRDFDATRVIRVELTFNSLKVLP